MTRFIHYFSRSRLAWYALLFGCLAWADAGAASAAFDGNAVPGCPLTGKTYNCAALPLSAYNDTTAIASGYTVNVKGNVVFGYNQGLSMSGSAALNAAGDLDIGDINPNILSIAGGNLSSGGAFTIGNQAQTVTANISAATMTLGSGSATRINGNVAASGAISISSNVIIVGAISGTTIGTNSPVNLTGNITASTSFTLASGSKVKGNIVAPTVTMQPSGSTVTGDIIARTSLQLGSSDVVTGDVTAGTLVLDDSNAMVQGNATVDRATLNWAGRITKTTYCTGGTVSGRCDCVVNNSGYPVNSANGPRCAAAPSAAPDHYLIVHDGSGSACTPEPVTVKACANAACSSLYTGGASVTLQPGGAVVTIGSSGVSSGANVSQTSPGQVALSLSTVSVGANSAVQCDNTSDSGGAGSGSQCNMSFTGSVGLSLTGANQAALDQYAATPTDLMLTAKVFDANNNKCAAAFAGQTKTVQLSCTYSNPAGGSLPVNVTIGNYVAANAKPASAAASGLCGGGGRDFVVQFSANGDVRFQMRYDDVGKLQLSAATDNGSGGTVGAAGDVIVAPAAFQISSYTTPTIAGKPFDVIATALNAAGNATPNFGKEVPTAETVTFSRGTPNTQGCSVPAASFPEVSPPAAAAVVVPTGILGKPSYREAGAFNIQVVQASNAYLGGTKPRPTAVQTNAAGAGCGAISSVPAYFQVQEGRVGDSTLPNFYYSGEPIDLTVKAMNASGELTQLYDKDYGYSKAVTLTALDEGGSVIPGTIGGLTGAGASSGTPVPASAFRQGVATILTTDPSPLVFSFVSPLPTPLKVRLRAAEPGTGGVSSKDAGTYGKPGEAIFDARKGRVSVGSRFGNARGDLDIPVARQYWTGANWITNANDTDALHPVPVAAIAIQAVTSSLSKPTTVPSSGALTLDKNKGQGVLTLRPTGGTGTATVAINLGSAAVDNACAPHPAGYPATTGAAMPYLRSSCGSASAADPSARATFGVTKPETKLLIHTREAFN